MQEKGGRPDYSSLTTRDTAGLLTRIGQVYPRNIPQWLRLISLSLSSLYVMSRDIVTLSENIWKGCVCSASGTLNSQHKVLSRVAYFLVLQAIPCFSHTFGISRNASRPR